VKRIDPIWIFGPVPNHFWDDEENRRDYLLWLGHRLRFHWMEDWYRITKEAITSNHGGSVLRYHRHSPSAMVMELFPEFQWHEWMFGVTRKGFWHRPENRKRYVQWLGKRLGIRKPEDWFCVEQRDLCNNYGRFLLTLFPSVLDVLEECFPDLDWDAQRYQPLSVDQILRWADRYFQQRGKWPTVAAGPIPGTDASWRSVNGNLLHGHRGLPDGDSLARLLEKERGVRNSKRLPQLSEKQILRWADAYFKRHGKWPNSESGPIEGTAEEWPKIAKALEYGCRGLPGGSSLIQILERRRGARNRSKLPKLTEKQIVRWARSYRKATGRRPYYTSGLIVGTNGETWSSVETALREGRRGLRGGQSLARLLRKHGMK